MRGACSGLERRLVRPRKQCENILPNIFGATQQAPVLSQGNGNIRHVYDGGCELDHSDLGAQLAGCAFRRRLLCSPRTLRVVRAGVALGKRRALTLTRDAQVAI